MDVAPVVVEDTQPGVLEVEAQVWVEVLKAAKLHPRRRLDDGLRGAAEEHIHLFAVPRTKLLTGHHALDVLAVSEKHAALDGSQNDAAVDAVVDGDGRRVVKHVDVAVLALLDDKLLPIEFPRQTAHCDIFQPVQHVVFRVDLGRGRSGHMMEEVYFATQNCTLLKLADSYFSVITLPCQERVFFPVVKRIMGGYRINIHASLLNLNTDIFRKVSGKVKHIFKYS